MDPISLGLGGVDFLSSIFGGGDSSSQPAQPAGGNKPPSETYYLAQNAQSANNDQYSQASQSAFNSAVLAQQGGSMLPLVLLAVLGIVAVIALR